MCRIWSAAPKDLSDKLLGLAAVCAGVDGSGNVKEWCHFFLILFVGVDGAKMHSRQLLTSLKWSIKLPYHKRPWRPSCRTLGPYQQGSSTRRSDTCKNTWKDKMSTINNPSQNQANTSSTQHISWEAPVFLTIFRQPTFFTFSHLQVNCVQPHPYGRNRHQGTTRRGELGEKKR